MGRGGGNRPSIPTILSGVVAINGTACQVSRSGSSISVVWWLERPRRWSKNFLSDPLRWHNEHFIYLSFWPVASSPLKMVTQPLEDSWSPWRKNESKLKGTDTRNHLRDSKKKKKKNGKLCNLYCKAEQTEKINQDSLLQISAPQFHSAFTACTDLQQNRLKLLAIRSKASRAPVKKKNQRRLNKLTYFCHFLGYS